MNSSSEIAPDEPCVVGSQEIRPVAAPVSSLHAFCQPTNVAVIGASVAVGKAGSRRWRSVVDGGFAGRLFPIHPSAETMLGHRVYRSITEVPEQVDLAVIMVRAESVAAIVAECARAKVKAVVVISAGFGETGAEGQRVERELAALLRQAGGRLLGPNCAGLFSGSTKLNLLGWSPPLGSVGFISQSGGMAITFAQMARARGLGFSRLLTTGNAVDVRLPELVAFLLADDDTKVIVAYVEGLKADEGRELFNVVESSASRKPVVIFKPGRTPTGTRAVLSHTGTLAGKDRVFEAAMKQAGALRVDEAEEAWDAVYALAQLPVMACGSIGIIADGGGTATVIADAAARAGLEVPELSQHRQRELASFLPRHASVVNPIDLVVTEEQPEVIARALKICFADPTIGAVVLGGHFGGYFKLATAELGHREEMVAHDLVTITREHCKPLIVQSAHAIAALPALETLRCGGIPVYGGMESAAKAMAVVWQHSRNRQRIPSPAQRRSQPARQTVLTLLKNAVDGVLLDPHCRCLLQHYGIRMPPALFGRNPGETAAAADTFGCRVALKLVSSSIVHKSDIGGVLLNVKGGDEAAAGHNILMQRAIGVGVRSPSVLITPMLDGGPELVVGMINDTQFGPVVMFGLGGIFVEFLEDVSFRLAPLNETIARQMICETKVARLLAGARGRPPCDIDALVDILLRVAELGMDYPQIGELELNPIFPRGTDAAIADVRVLVRVHTEEAM